MFTDSLAQCLDLLESIGQVSIAQMSNSRFRVTSVNGNTKLYHAQKVIKVLRHDTMTDEQMSYNDSQTDAKVSWSDSSTGKRVSECDICTNGQVSSCDGGTDEKVLYYNVGTHELVSECQIILDSIFEHYYHLPSVLLPSTDYIVSIYRAKSFSIVMFEDYENRFNDILLPVTIPSLVNLCKAVERGNFGILLDLLLESYPTVNEKIGLVSLSQGDGSA